MTEFNWEESDDEYTKLESSNEVSLSDVIYGFGCPECNGEVSNDHFDPDADGPTWYYTCHDCEIKYGLHVSTVRAMAFDADL